MGLGPNLRTVAMMGMGLSIISLVAHFFLARYSGGKMEWTYYSKYPIVSRVGSWRISRTDDLDMQSNYTVRAWRPVKKLQAFHPYAFPRDSYPAPTQNGPFLFAEIRGGFHEIRSSICDLVVIARILNATLVIPDLQAVHEAKGISSNFKGFDYIYNVEHFILELANDIPVVTGLPTEMSLMRKGNEFTIKTPRIDATPEFYLEKLLLPMKKKGAAGLIISGGGCLQKLLPARLAEYQRLRCRVAFHALRFRDELQQLGTSMVQRLKASNKPYLALHLGLERDVLAYHGCGERFQDVHTQLIQYKRNMMIRAGIIQGELDVDSEKQWLNGSCPLLPEEVGIILRATGYKQGSRLYLSGAETFGGQRVLLPLRSMFPNIEDRMTLSTEEERSMLYDKEERLPPPPPLLLQKEDEKARLAAWAKAGPRPRPLPPPAGRPKYPHEREGWWGWVAERDKEPEDTIADMRRNGHRLLWEALDYMICIEADVFFPSFDKDKNGRPGFASLVIGHRAYASTSLRTVRLNRRSVARLLMEIQGHKYKPPHDWNVAVRNLTLKGAEIDGLVFSALHHKPRSFISHPLPECICWNGANESRPEVIKAKNGRILIGDEEQCPEWMRPEPEKSRDDPDYFEESELLITGKQSSESGLQEVDKVDDTSTSEPEEEADLNE